MSKLTQDQLENYELSHRHGGNGYVMCEDIDGDYCRVTPVHTEPTTFGTRAFLASKAHMAVFQRPVPETNQMVDIAISDEVAGLLKLLRQDFKSGKLGVFSTHTMPAKRAKELREALMR